MTIEELITHSIDKDMEVFFLRDTDTGGVPVITLNFEKKSVSLGLFDSREAAEAFKERLSDNEELSSCFAVESMPLSEYIKEFDYDA